MKTKRAWTRIELALFLVPLVIAATATALWRKKTAPPAIPSALLTIYLANTDGNNIAFSPDGNRLAILTRSGGLIYSSRTGALQTALRFPAARAKRSLISPAWSPDGSRLAACSLGMGVGTAVSAKSKFNLSQSNTLLDIGLWNAVSGMPIQFFPLAPANEFAFATLSWPQSGKLWNKTPLSSFDLKRGGRRRRFGPAYDINQTLPHDSVNGSYSLMSVSRTVRALGKASGETSIYRIADAKLLHTIKTKGRASVTWGSTDDVIEMRWDELMKPNGTATVKKRQLIDARTGNRLPLPPGIVADQLIFAGKGQVAVIFKALSGSPDEPSVYLQRVILWDYRRAQERWQIGAERPLAADFRDWSFSPDGRRCSALDWRQPSEHATTRVVWDVATGTEIWRLPFPNIERQKSVWSPDSRFIALPDESSIHIYRVPV